MILLSHPVSETTPLYPGTQPVRFIRDANELPASTDVRLDTHSGTNLDVPSHFCPGGQTLEEVVRPAQEYCPVQCLEAPASGPVGLAPEHVHGVPDAEAEGILLRTGDHRRRASDPRGYSEDHPFLTPRLVLWLTESCPRLRIVGVDCISVAHPRRPEEGAEVHRALLCRDPPALILEDLDLSHGPLSEGAFSMIIFPMLYGRLDGTPAAAVARPLQVP